MVSKNDEFIIKVDDVKPKTTNSGESEFIAKTMKQKPKEKEIKEKKPKKQTDKKEQKETKEKKKTETKTNKSTKTNDEIKEEKEIEYYKIKDKHIKEVHEIEENLDRDIEVRKLIHTTTPKEGIIKTKDLLGQGFHYFINLEQKIT